LVHRADGSVGRCFAGIVFGPGVPVELPLRERVFQCLRRRGYASSRSDETLSLGYSGGYGVLKKEMP